MPDGSPPLPPVAILCGGAGTRLREHARSIPKPLVEIGGRPILWHVIQLYLAHGFSEVLLLTGFRAKAIERFAGAGSWPPGVTVSCLPTGTATPTGGRLRQAADLVASETICVSYADGVADIDLRHLLAYHRGHRCTATMTVVQPELPFGVAELDGDGAVRGFAEKPRCDHWVNAGFFCFERKFLQRLAPDSTLEREPLAQLASAGELRAYHHSGFWRCMDTYKDAVALNDLWTRGQAPWQLW
ncbi:MAG: NTP transferase domain-containing protein [Solirubrobacterales bacterium]|nr:NTP transferase domain-containing protein [Solirubrobacterales bacterium]